MPLTKVVKRRGAVVAIEAHGEALMTPVGPVGVWAATLSRAITASTKRAAPRNSRPYWGHYAGSKRLHESITTSTNHNPATMLVTSVVGSSSHYALFVDQGTGVHAGKSPYPAKILPPWKRGEASLYEATWRPHGPGERPVSRVMIKGQKGQNFFSKGIKMGMLSMGVIPATVPGDPYAHLERANRTNIPGAAPPQMPLFRLQLAEWRIWRDEAWKAGETLGRDGGGSSAYARKKAAAARKPTKPKATPKPKPKATKPSKPQKPKKPTPPKPKGDNTGAAIVARIKKQFTSAGHSEVSVTLNPKTGMAIIKYRSRQGTMQKTTRPIKDYLV